MVRSRFFGGLAGILDVEHPFNEHLTFAESQLLHKKTAEDRWRYRVLEDEEGRYPPSHFLITLILNHQSVNCATSPMTLRCQSTLLFGYEQIWRMEEGALRQPSQMITG